MEPEFPWISRASYQEEARTQLRKIIPKTMENIFILVRVGRSAVWDHKFD